MGGVIYPFSSQFWEDLARRIRGPGGFRFVVQPLVAVLLGIRDGLQDAKAERPPYVIGVLFHREQRSALLRSGAQELLKPIIVAVILDSVFQFLILGRVYPGAAVIVGIFLMAIPYVVARGLANRIARRRHAQTMRRM